ncbi:MAG TPA: hypothetical protein VMT60_02470, partial [Candidatus Bathyarchaeia archaeon]|nr:hypothetical protein [Candidatus Bathyarchaeia archaeon]
MVFLLVVICALLAVNVVRHPSLLKAYGEYLGEKPGEGKDAARRRLDAQFYGILHERNPKLLPAEMRVAVEARDDKALAAYLSSHKIGFAVNSDTKKSTFDEGSGTLHLGSDVIAGLGGLATGVPYFIAY